MTKNEILSKYKPDAISEGNLLAFSWPLVEKMLDEALSAGYREHEMMRAWAEGFNFHAGVRGSKDFIQFLESISKSS